jgi:aspartyl-tRNA(Asn)/glutamyl-tRNA(Gln) amidotransferase subunit C
MLTAEEVQHTASLARITLSEEEIATFQSDLSKVLIFFKELETLDTEKDAEIGHITGRENEARGDQVQEVSPETRSHILKNFPEAEGDFLKVRSVL